MELILSAALWMAGVSLIGRSLARLRERELTIREAYLGIIYLIVGLWMLTIGAAWHWNALLE